MMLGRLREEWSEIVESKGVVKDSEQWDSTTMTMSAHWLSS